MATTLKSQQLAKFEHVMIRGQTVYANIPLAPGGSRRRVALSWLRAKAEQTDKGLVLDLKDANAKLKLGSAVLSRIETHLVVCQVPQWDIIAAIHDERVSVQHVATELATVDGVQRLVSQLQQMAAAHTAAVEVAPLVDRWPAMPLDKTIEPTPATRKNRRARMKVLASRLPLLSNWTTAGLQGVINPAGQNGTPVGKGSTQMTYLRDTKLFCAWLMAQGLLNHDPSVGVTVQQDEKKEMRCVDFAVLMKLYDALPAGHIRHGFGLMMSTGGEPQVLDRLTGGDVRRTDRHVRLRGTKNSYRTRWAFVENWFWPTLEALAEGRRSDEKLIPVTRFQLADAVRAAVAELRAREPELDLPADFRPYDARHSFAARYVKAGAVLKVIASQLGHKDERMVIALYGQFRVETSGLANFQQTAETEGVNLRPQRLDVITQSRPEAKVVGESAVAP